MNIAEFLDQYNAAAASFLSGGLEGIPDFFKHKTKDAKQFRDELTAIYGFIVTTSPPKSEVIIIGGETENFDAQVADKLLEVVRALPSNEHKIRNASADGVVPDASSMTPTDYTAQRLADLISNALAHKQKKHYSDERVLLISVDGEDTQEEDQTINEAVSIVQKAATLEPFSAIWVVETGRRKAFRILPQ